MPDHHGAYFDVRGPIGAARSAQGQPVIFQAGSSDTGRAFAARHAEVIFTSHGNRDRAQQFYGRSTTRPVAMGRVSRR